MKSIKLIGETCEDPAGHSLAVIIQLPVPRAPAFEKAMTRPAKKVASITKSNAQGYGMVLWDEVFCKISREFPDVETEPTETYFMFSF